MSENYQNQMNMNNNETKQEEPIEDDDYEDTETIILLSQANKILNQKELTEDDFKFFTSIDSIILMKIVNQLSKEKSEKLMNYLSKEKNNVDKNNHNHGNKQNKSVQKKINFNITNNNDKKHDEIINKPKEFFNPSAPVWLDDNKSNNNNNNNNTNNDQQQMSNPSILNQLLREHEEENNKKIGKDSSYLYRQKKYRMDPHQYRFDDLAKYHEKQSIIYPFYSVVAKVMYSYGDLLQNDPSAIEMMHSQIEEILKALFQKKFIIKLIKQSKQKSSNLYELDFDDYDDNNNNNTKDKFIFPKTSKAIKRCFNSYFQAVFPEQFKIYQRFKETYQGIKEEGGFFNNKNKNNEKNKNGQEQNNDNSSSDESNDEEQNNNIMVNEDENEDHQLKEMKDHFDRDDDEEDYDDENNNNNKLNKNNEKQSLQKKGEKKNKDLIFFDDNDDEEEDEDDEEDDDEEEQQETLDTIKQIEQIVELDEDKKNIDEQTNTIKQTDDNNNTPKIEQKVLQQSKQQQQQSQNKKQQDEQQIQQNEDRLYMNEEDRISFNKQRTDEMSNEEWNYFMHVRCISFTSHGNRKGFREFLNIQKYGHYFLESINIFIPFLSYCICKMIGIVIEQILRSRNHGQLKLPDAPISQNEVQLFGNNIIEKYINRANKHILSKSKLILSAFNVFKNEYHTYHYDKILHQYDKSNSSNSAGNASASSSVGKLSKSNAKNNNKVNTQNNNNKNNQEDENRNNELLMREEWKNMRTAYKKMWVERIISEKQIKKFLDEKLQQIKQSQQSQSSQAQSQSPEQLQHQQLRQAIQELQRIDSSKIQFINKYASYLYERALEDIYSNNHQNYSSILLSIDYSQHFKNWFLNNDTQRTGSIKKAVFNNNMNNNVSNSNNINNNNNLLNQTKDQKRKIIKFESILD